STLHPRHARWRSRRTAPETDLLVPSADDVRARTGASRSQLYHYFEDRDDLVHAVIDVTIDAVLDTQGELLDHLDSWAGIDRWFDSLVQHQTGRQACGGCPIAGAKPIWHGAFIEPSGHNRW